jgi:hypothetical protein
LVFAVAVAVCRLLLLVAVAVCRLPFAVSGCRLGFQLPLLVAFVAPLLAAELEKSKTTHQLGRKQVPLWRRHSGRQS